ncbi:uncharacterized protein [Triticum aestivum]|uniref:uncharacterized protein n=1 Tax=Triticum aestivum TaxID=4565 RepID=UPI001D01FEB3|nr:uncharacterized protein LOC123142456 [Triticum aestivum]
MEAYGTGEGVWMAGRVDLVPPAGSGDEVADDGGQRAGRRRRTSFVLFERWHTYYRSAPGLRSILVPKGESIDYRGVLHHDGSVLMPVSLDQLEVAIQVTDQKTISRHLMLLALPNPAVGRH